MRDLSPLASPALAPERRSTPGSLIDSAQAYLREDILTGQLVPGQRLKIKELSESLGIGPTPLREALSKLASNGLVQSESHKGFFVPTVSEQELEDLLTQRMTIETAALAASIESGDKAWEDRVVTTFNQLTEVETNPSPDPRRQWLRWENANHNFHRALVGGSESKWAPMLLEILYDQTERYRGLKYPDLSYTAQASEDHRAIKEAALARDVEAAVGLLKDHIGRMKFPLID
ncbi:MULTISPECIES: GntR family transcriptional regulator [Pseudovibrio]|uniref:GntR family transcriptional regulator n=1 Tax=Stappiaceae TaxID=2821832 RepID=UPI002365C0E4|nr:MULTISPECIES: GntR family transcriptional regulator [Pseudovibrio]MDD7911632.1 GntR family transcriptional regulator [Pseudovibrio exalbescens]MDX5594368.1 GntR family transcriptional regulator [Pseudovibrio sp. SPO723]